MMSFNEIVVSCHHCLYPGPEPLAGPSHGVLLEAAHLLLNHVDQGVQSFLKTFINIQRSNAPQISVL
jgi:hypothetical protein